MIPNEPVVAVVGVVVSVLTVLTVDVNGVVVAVVRVEADDVVPADSDDVVNGVEVTVLSAKHRRTYLSFADIGKGSIFTVGCTLFLLQTWSPIFIHPPHSWTKPSIRRVSSSRV